MRLDLLAIAAHPDDVELTCGGTLLKMAGRGYKTGILDLTAGEMGTRGTPQTRAKEAAKAAKLLRVTWRQVLGVPDSDVQASRQHKLRLAAVIRELRPKTVILPYWEARHPDHYNASTLGYEGCFLAGLKQLPMEARRIGRLRFCTRRHSRRACGPRLWLTSRNSMNGAGRRSWRMARSSGRRRGRKRAKCSWGLRN